MKPQFTRSSLIFLLGFLSFIPTMTPAEQTKPQQPSAKEMGVTLPFSACLASPTWLDPSNQPPTEIGNGIPLGSETNCQFYQFSYQWFLSMMQPVASDADERAFEALNLYLPNLKNQCSKPKLSALKNLANIGKALFIRTLKTDEGTFDPVLPEETAQATGQALYDQADNVVLYNVWYNNTECQSTSQGFQPNTVEMKSSWRILTGNDPSYHTITASVPAISKQPLTLGLVGVHLAINTANHPEFIWATFEHKSNTPDCTHPQNTPNEGWSFTSAGCAACLADQTPQQCAAAQPQCSFNAGVKPQALKGTPNEVCRVYSDGTDPEPMTNGNNNDTNRADIDMLNAQLVGQAGMITQLPASNPMAVLKNYLLVGGLWTNGGGNSTTPNAQRGSLELSNMTMETFFQDRGNNCFTCHGYTPSNPLDASHIINQLLSTGVSKLN